MAKKYFMVEVPFDIKAEDIRDSIAKMKVMGTIEQGECMLTVTEIPDPGKYARIPSVKEFDDKLNRILRNQESTDRGQAL